MPGRDAAERAQLLRIALLLGGPVLIIGGFTLFFISRRFALPAGVLLAMLILQFPATWGLILLVEQATSRASHSLISTLYAADVDGISPGFSRQEALVAQGRLEEATVAYRLHLAEHPTDVAGLVALARLLAGPQGDAEGAALTYREARRQPNAREWERLIANDLIDLYERMGDLGRLQVELARFASGHPGTAAGEAAAGRLRELKDRPGLQG